jgi:hypothetical protein
VRVRVRLSSLLHCYWQLLAFAAGPAVAVRNCWVKY